MLLEVNRSTLTILIREILKISTVYDDDSHNCKRIQFDKPKISDNCPTESLEVFFYRTIPPALKRIFQFLLAAGALLT